MFYVKIEGVDNYIEISNMSLREIKDELYTKDPDEKVLEHATSEFSPDASNFNFTKQKEATKDDWVLKEESLEQGNKRMLKIGGSILGGLLLVIAIVVGFYKIKQAFYSSEGVIVSLSGPAQIKSGSMVDYEISYENKNRADLENVALRITYPEGFKPEVGGEFKSDGTMASILDVGMIKSKSKGSVIFRGQIYSPRGNLINLKAELGYMPSTISTKFVASGQLAVMVSSVPIALEMMAPQNISSNDEVNYLLTYKNEGTEVFENVRIKLDYPEGFTFSSSDPGASEGNNIWYIGNLAGGQSGKIVAVGKLEGIGGDVRRARAVIGMDSAGQFVEYNEEDAETKIVASPLTIKQSVNGLMELVANAGDSLRFKINYKNEGVIGLRDVVVTEHIDSPVLDYATLDIGGGAYDAGSKTITWKASDFKELKNLAPGEGGVIEFSVRVKEVIPVTNSNDKNFVISSVAKIDSPDIPTPISFNKIISGNKIDIKLNSKLILAVRGYYNDANIPNSGPIPPKVGEETTYTMHFSVSNISNDVEGAVVNVVLPTSVLMTGKIFPEGLPVAYNERTNSVAWTIGNLAAGTGISSSPKEMAFQVKIKPSITQVGDFAPLLEEAVLSARDLFTGESISARVEDKSTRLPEDDELGSNYRVTN